MSWEYAFLEWRSGDESTAGWYLVVPGPRAERIGRQHFEALNSAGARGWELCLLTEAQYGAARYVFKRPAARA
jgi:hypothetical protein